MIDIKLIVNELNITQAELAFQLGVSPTAVSAVRNGRIDFPKDWSRILKEKFNINVDDPKYIKIDTDNQAAIPNVNSNIIKKEVLQIYPRYMEVPFIPIKAQAGYLDQFADGTPFEPEMVLVPIQEESRNYAKIV